MVYTNSTHLLSLQLVLWMKTRRLLWLHTTFKWTLCKARQNQQDYRDLDWGQNSGKSNKWRLLYAVSGSLSVCFTSVSLKAARIIRLGLIVYVFISRYHSLPHRYFFMCFAFREAHRRLKQEASWNLAFEADKHHQWTTWTIKQTLNYLCVVYHPKKLMNIFATVSTSRGETFQTFLQRLIWLNLSKDVHRAAFSVGINPVIPIMLWGVEAIIIKYSTHQGKALCLSHMCNWNIWDNT